MGDQGPDCKSERYQTETSERSSGGVKARGLSSPHRAVETCSILLLLFVLLNQRRASRENCWKSQEKTSDRGTKSFRNDSCKYGDCPAESKSKKMLVPLRSAQCG